MKNAEFPLLTLEELKRLFAVITDRRDKTFFLLVYRHGLQAFEGGLLQRPDVGLRQDWIAVHRLKGPVGDLPHATGHGQAPALAPVHRLERLPLSFPL